MKQLHVSRDRIDALFAEAESYVAVGRNGEALRTLKTAIGLSREPEVARRASLLLERLNPNVPSRPENPGARIGLDAVVERYLRDPFNSSVAQVVRQAIVRLAARLSVHGASSLSVDETRELAVLLSCRAFDDTDGGWRAAVLGANAGTAPFLTQALVLPPWQIDQVPPLSEIPVPLRSPLLKNLLQAPRCFDEPGLAERYHWHLTRVTTLVRDQIGRPRTLDATAASLAECFVTNLKCIPLYVSREDTLPLMRERAALIEALLASSGQKIDHVFVPAPNRPKVRIGFLSQHFGHQTETYVTLGSLHLDRSRFDISLFAVRENPGPTELYARSLADRFCLLPKALSEQANVIRGAGLDVLVIGTNITAITNPVAILAAHRLAPLQIASYCSPMSSGFRNIDYFLHSRHSADQVGDAQFSEKLIRLEAPPGCLDYTVEPVAEAGPRTRAEFGIADDEVLFVNAASVYKISFEALDAWCRILRRVERSRLMLMPYNPNWASSFPVGRFEALLNALATRHGIRRERILLVESQPSRQAVMKVERLGDVYLDTFPFSGSLAIHDVLEIGMPIVASAGVAFREQLSAAILREIGLREMVTTSVDEYVERAERLGREARFRADCSARIREAFAARTRATAPELFGAELGAEIWRLLGRAA